MFTITLRFSLLLLLLTSAPVLGQDTLFDNSELAWESRNKEYLIDLFTVGGAPQNRDADHKVKILVNHGYAVGYCEVRRCPLWAVYTASKIMGGNRPQRYERTRFFVPDIRTTPTVDGRTFGGGFDRGHMVPNAAIGNQYGSLAQMETFLMTNMCPQKSDLNQGAWMRLEQWIIDAAQQKEHIHVICGPIFGDDPAVVNSGSERGIRIPDAFYKIIVDTEYEFRDRPTVRLLAYIFPQNTDRSANFRDRDLFGASVAEIEAATNLNFFPKFDGLIPNWSDKESVAEMAHWSLDLPSPEVATEALDIAPGRLSLRHMQPVMPAEQSDDEFSFAELREENERLRRQLHQAELDLQTLKRAAAYFARESQ